MKLVVLTREFSLAFSVQECEFVFGPKPTRNSQEDASKVSYAIAVTADPTQSSSYMFDRRNRVGKISQDKLPTKPHRPYSQDGRIHKRQFHLCEQELVLD